MDSDDVAFLKSFNQKQGKKPHCSEDEFEEIINFFEEKTQDKQPYAEVDNTPVLAYEELEAEFDETISESSRRFAKDVYAHWKNQRLLKSNRPLLPALKFEKNLETDDADPYVCFRRREVRQVRKTRGRDAQVTEKIKKLRKDLEDARVLMSLVKRREMSQREQLHWDKTIFEQRLAVKDIRRKLNIKTDDEDILITQKVCRLPIFSGCQANVLQPAPKPKRPADIERARQNIPGMKPRDTRPDGRLVDSDLVYLEEQQAKRSEAIDSFIEENLAKHQRWNVGWVDATWRPITPPLEQAAAKSDFRTVFTESQLPTPPASVSDEEGADTMAVERVNKQIESRRDAQIRFASPPEDVPIHDQSRFRRRIGRGGRIMIDRRGVKRQKIENSGVDERVADRWKFSGDSSDDEQTYPVDWYDDWHIRYRISQTREDQKEQQKQAGPIPPHRRSIENHNRSASGHLMPPTPTKASAG